jgi:galactokinase
MWPNTPSQAAKGKSELLRLESGGELLKSRFRAMFGAEAEVFRAPARVNLIGEHTDYNDGFVMPAAIAFYTSIAAARRRDRILEVYSERFDEKIALSLDNLAGPPRRHWSDFVRGVAATLQQAGHRLAGANLAIHGEIPLGAGLSSSASLEMATAYALTSVSAITVPRLELVKLCQAAEHEYVGTRCGIMDQFSVSFGVVGQAIMLDCRSLDFELLAIPSNCGLVISNSMVRHELASGEYNRRRMDCETGVRALQEHLPKVQALRDVEIEDLEKYKRALPELVYRRCRHVVTENQRVLAAARALRTRDTTLFGDLMYRSHASLRDDYAVSCNELDLLVNLASRSPGVYGARMTGGGFGGCTVNLVHADHVPAFTTHIATAYRETTGITPEIYLCQSPASRKA